VIVTLRESGMSEKSSKVLVRRSAENPSKPPARALLTDVRELIVQARAGVARAVDSGLTMLYWHIGRRIRQDILMEKRAEYGQKIVSALGTQLSAEFGRGFGVRNLFRMVRFAEVFPDDQIVSALRTQLGWTGSVSTLLFCLRQHQVVNHRAQHHFLFSSLRGDGSKAVAQVALHHAVGRLALSALAIDFGVGFVFESAFHQPAIVTHRQLF
jgi:hypothetical protein